MANKVHDLDADQTADGVKTTAVPRTWLDSGNMPDWVTPVRINGDGVDITLDATDSNITVPAETTLNPSDVTDEMIQLLKEIKGQLGTSDIHNPDTLSFGDMDAGFFGIIPAEDFITGDDLASDLGITQGTGQFSDTPWLKFAFNQKVLVVPMKTIRHSISWDAIYEAGAVYGTGSDISSGEQWMLDNDDNYSESDRVDQDATVSVNGRTYKVRLFKGAGDDPTDSYDDNDRGSLGDANEWNALMLPIHEKARNADWDYSEYVPASVSDWAVYFSDGDLLTHRDFGNGSYSWCQETRDTSTSRRVLRGGNGVSFLYARTSPNTASSRGWRPVLELDD